MICTSTLVCLAEAVNNLWKAALLTVQHTNRSGQLTCESNMKLELEAVPVLSFLQAPP